LYKSKPIFGSKYYKEAAQMEILILGGSSLLFLLTGIILLYKNTQFVKNAIKTIGEIVEISDYMGTSSRKKMYSSVVEFQTFNNSSIRFPNPSSSTTKPEIGKKVEVYYYEDRPEKAKIASVVNLYVLPVVLIALGLLLLFLTAQVAG